MSKNLFKTYEVNGRQYTDNLPPNSFISISKKQYIEYEQQKEEIERLNNIINEIEKLCIDNLIYDELGMKVLDQPFILDKIEELKGSDKE